MFDFEDYYFSADSVRNSFTPNSRNQPTADVFGNGSFVNDLELYRDYRDDTPPTATEVADYADEFLRDSGIILTMEELFAFQSIVSTIRQNPDVVDTLNTASDFILDYQIDVARITPPFENARENVEAATNEDLRIDAFNAASGDFESVQEYRYLIGIDDDFFGPSLDTFIRIDTIFLAEDNVRSIFSNFSFEYTPNYTFATDAIFGGGSGGGGGSGSALYDSLRLYSENTTGDIDEDDG
jgi:hypothetical protein